MRELIAVCTECKSDQPDKYIENSPFGDAAPCKYCAGVIIICEVGDQENAVRQHNQQHRGFS